MMIMMMMIMIIIIIIIIIIKSFLFQIILLQNKLAVSRLRHVTDLQTLTIKGTLLGTWPLLKTKY